MTLPSHGITVGVPRRWSTRSDVARGIVLAARAQDLPTSGFAPEFVVRAIPVASELAAWRQEALAALSDQLDGFELEDADHFDLGPGPVAYRRFSHLAHGIDLLCEQWAWLVEGLGVTLTGSMARTDYLDYDGVFEEVAATVEITPPPVSYCS